MVKDTPMTREEFTKRLTYLESAGFLVVILTLWVDEILDIPYLFLGGEATPINFRESILETVLVAVLAVLVVSQTQHLIQRVRHLEGILPVCSICKKIRSEDQWVPIEGYIRDHSDVEFSHSLCPECLEKYYGDFGKSKER